MGLVQLRLEDRREVGPDLERPVVEKDVIVSQPKKTSMADCDERRLDPPGVRAEGGEEAEAMRRGDGSLSAGHERLVRRL